MKTSNKSIKVLLASTNRVIVYILVSFTLIAFVGASLIMYQSHTIICEMFKLELEDTSYVISREIALNEQSIAEQAFLQFKDSFSRSGIETHLSLDKIQVRNDTGNVCEPGVFYSKINYPLFFSNQQIGRIYGHILAYRSFVPFVFFVLFIIFILFSFFQLKKNLFSEINNQFVIPVLQMSQSRNLGRTDVVDEVRIIAENLEKLKTVVAINEKEKSEIEYSKNLAAIIRQLNHDIASPLLALDTILKSKSMSPLDEDTKLMSRFSVDRIKEILSGLNYRYDIDKRYFSENVYLGSILINIIQEKMIEVSEMKNILFQLDFSSGLNIFVNICKASFKRSISNLLNNAIEALDTGGNINIGVRIENQEVIIDISDDGKGIPSDVLDELNLRSFSFDKPNGSGLGLKFARDTLRDCAGRLQINSLVNSGTTVSLFIPLANSSSWFTPPNFEEVDDVVIIDNDHGIHHLWKEKLKKKNCKLHHFFSGKDFIDAFSSLKLQRSPMFLCDYDLGESNPTGLEVILQANINSNVFIVSNSYENDQIQKKICKHNIPIIPKNVVEYINI